MRKATRTRHNDPEGLRNLVLDAAAALFQARGYHATGTREILKATGLSSGALHHHFPTKESLALAVISDRVAPTVRETWIDPIREARSVKAAVLKVFVAIIRGIDRRGAVFGCPLNNLAMELSFSHPSFVVAAVYSRPGSPGRDLPVDQLGGRFARQGWCRGTLWRRLHWILVASTDLL